MLVHQFSVQIADQVFVHDSGALAVGRHEPRERYRVADVARLDLHPLLVLGYFVEGTRYRRTWIVDPRASVDAARFLHAVWKKTGLPDALKIRRELFEACPALEEYLRDLAIPVDMVASKDKSYNANMVASQLKASSLPFHDRRPPGTSIIELKNLDDERYAEFHQGHYAPIGMVLTRGRSAPAQQGVLSLQQTSWMLRNQTAIPKLDDVALQDCENGTYVLIHDVERHNERVDDVHTRYGPYMADGPVAESLATQCLEDLVPILRAMPGGTFRAREALGVTQRELEWVLTGKRPLKDSGWRQLMKISGVGFDDRFPGFIRHQGSVSLEVKTAGQGHRMFEFMNGGGDHDHAVEIVPTTFEPSREWRFVLTTYSTSTSILAMRRGDVADRLISPEGLIGLGISNHEHDGRSPQVTRAIDDELYTMVTTYWQMLLKPAQTWGPYLRYIAENGFVERNLVCDLWYRHFPQKKDPRVSLREIFRDLRTEQAEMLACASKPSVDEETSESRPS